MRYLLALSLLLLTGCTGALPANFNNMTPEQIKAVTADKNMSGQCTIANTPYGKLISVFMAIDKSVIVNGGVSVDDQCKIQFTNTLPPKP